MGVSPGLERIAGLMALMGDPHLDSPVIHVAGTNGKTSTARLATAILTAHDLSTGTFTSPHLERVEQRYAVHGETISPQDFVAAVSDVAAFSSIYEADEDRLTYFELTTAVAFSLFVEKAVQVAVVEVGLGGRLDATNIVDGDVAVITDIGLDHTEYLGSDLAAIAGEKVAIAKPGSSLVAGDLAPEAAAVVSKWAEDLGITQHRLQSEFGIDEEELIIDGWNVDLRGIHGSYKDLVLPLHGRHQLSNLAIAIASVEALLGRELDADALRDSLSSVKNPGRFEIISRDPPLVLDGAHNGHGFSTLSDTLGEVFPGERWTLVFGVMGDKDIETMMEVIAARLDRVIVTAIDHERAVPADELADEVRALVSVPVEAVPEPAQAVAPRGEGPLVVAGSLYLAGEVRPYLVGNR
ncbi:MAG: dihydrofolate synthase [Acidimicrobiia bacterium]|nr:dihydrofolate synthase [Acidimicrobiia bacterium]